MANFRGHITTSTITGLLYGGIGVNPLGMEPATAILGGVAATVGGLLPDLDCNNGYPVRGLFGVAASFVPLLLLQRLQYTSLNQEEVMLVLIGMYVFIRFGLKRFFNRLTVHRGMFHSVPAMLIVGLSIYLIYDSDDRQKKIFLGVGAMLGFLSHLILDEMYSVDFRGIKIRLNQYAGSALKFTSKSFLATTITYIILIGLSYLAYVDWQQTRQRGLERPGILRKQLSL
ncbi:MAG: metal-dependent hydrolase [Zavarzinella sp.]